jgi:hypothetical protein
MRRAIKFTPVTILRNGIVCVDGHMAYTDTRGNWLYVSEDGAHVYMYSNLTDMVREVYKRDGDDDFVVTGWDSSPTRFADSIDDAYNYYNARFED